MSDNVFYHHGLTCEADELLPLLRIEGRRVPVQLEDSRWQSPELTGEPPATLRALAEKLVEQSAEFEKRAVAKRQHLHILQGGTAAWNAWRREAPEVRPLLFDADLTASSFDPNLTGINFANAVLINADLRGRNLGGANFHEANLGGAKLQGAILKGANFCRTDLFGTDLTGANLTDANLQGTQMAGTILDGATLRNCTIYGMSAWDLTMAGACQENLRILFRKKTAEGKHSDVCELIAADLGSAQFVYSLLQSDAVSAAFDALTSQIVLILGRFSDGGLDVLHEVRKGLLALGRGYVPIIFEFDRPHDRTYTETVQTLAGLSRFVIADLSGPSVGQELHATVNDLQIPYVPILQQGRADAFTMMDVIHHPWVLPIVDFDDPASFVSERLGEIVNRIEIRVQERRERLEARDREENRRRALREGRQASV